MGSEDIRSRIQGLDWGEIERSLWEAGCARTPAVLTETECRALISLYTDDRRFRSRIDMERYRFGLGDYAYFGHPLPRLVRDLRTHLYRRLAPIANRFQQALGREPRFPRSLRAFLETCHAQGQRRPTPLLLHYSRDGYNCLHRDLYGAVSFPLQVTAFLSQPRIDYEGGEFLLVETRPRAQSRGESITPEQGELVIFPTSERPRLGKRGYTRTQMRHGVSRLRQGSRYTLGVIFHDAR